MTDALRKFKADIFQALAHPTRIAIIEALRDGERSAGQLMTVLNLEQANISQHLSILRAKQIVHNRKEGNQVFYSLVDPALVRVLEILKDYFFSRLTHSVNLLEEIQQPDVQRGREAGSIS